MTHIAGFERDQLLLLPEAVDDYVDADNPVRFIDAFVDGLDLAAAGFSRVTAKATGRPGYAPGELLKLYIYGYLNRVRSSRRLEREAHRNVEVIWLLGSLRPDFKTIADFRRDNRAAFRRPGLLRGHRGWRHHVVVMMVVMVVVVMMHRHRRLVVDRSGAGRGTGGCFLRDGISGEAKRENGRGRKGLDHGRSFPVV
jgi:transposase